MATEITAIADSTTGTVQITLFLPAPTSEPVHVVRVHPDGSEHEVIGSPVIMSANRAVLYDNAAPMDVPVFYRVYTTNGQVAYDGFVRTVVDSWNPGALNLPGAVGAFASTPDVAALDIVGDIDIRAQVSFASWTPATDQTLLSKFNATGNQRSWHFTLLPNGRLQFAWSPDGVAITSVDSTVATEYQPNLIRWVRVTLDAITGTVTFYTSDNGGGWTQLGDATTVGATSMLNSTAAVLVGARSAGTTDLMTGLVFSAQIYDSTGTLVADPRFDQRPGATSWGDSVGRAWSVSGAATIIEYPINLDWDWNGGAVSDYDVNVFAAGGTMTHPDTVLRTMTILTGLTNTRTETTVSINTGTVAGGGILVRVFGRATDLNNLYEVLLTYTTADTVTLSLAERVGGVFTVIAGPTGALYSGVTANQKFTIIIETEGPEIRAKVWATESDTEPANWTLQTSDLSITTGNLAGVASRRELANTNVGVIVSFHNFLVTGEEAEQPASTLRYNFAQTTQGWVGEGATTVAWVDQPAQSTPGSLQATKTMGAGFDSLRFNDNDQLPSNLLPWGTTLTAWVLVPEDAAGTNWLGRLEVQDSSFTWQAGEDVPLVPGLWIPLEYAAETIVLEDAHSIGVQIGATGVNGVQSVYLDSVTQTFNSVSNYVILDASPDGWLKHPTMPMLDIRLDNCEVHSPDCLTGDQLVFFKALDAETYNSASGVFDIVNTSRPFVVGQTRKDMTSTLVLVSRRLADITAIKKLLSSGVPLILNLPTIYGWGVETFGQDWIQVGDDTASRLGIDMRKPYRTWTLPFAVVNDDFAYPSGGTGGNGIGVAGATWGDLAASGQTWGQHAATGNWWLDTAQGEGY